MWERSFVAVSVLLGSDVDEALAMLPDPTRAGDLVTHLRDPRRAVRAQAIATAAAEVALALDQQALR